jgi:hypothetical protein
MAARKPDLPRAMAKVDADPSAEVWATVTMPLIDAQGSSAIDTHFAQIWSDPPSSEPGQDPGIVIHAFGQGKTVWVASPIESHNDIVSARTFIFLLKRVLQPPFQFEAKAHRAVEVTLFHQKDHRRLLLGAANLQEQVPATAVDATIDVQIPSGRKVRDVVLLPEQIPLSFSTVGPYVTFRIPPFKLLAMAMINYQ